MSSINGLDGGIVRGIAIGEAASTIGVSEDTIGWLLVVFEVFVDVDVDAVDQLRSGCFLAMIVDISTSSFVLGLTTGGNLIPDDRDDADIGVDGKFAASSASSCDCTGVNCFDRRANKLERFLLFTGEVAPAATVVTDG